MFFSASVTPRSTFATCGATKPEDWLRRNCDYVMFSGKDFVSPLAMISALRTEATNIGRWSSASLERRSGKVAIIVSREYRSRLWNWRADHSRVMDSQSANDLGTLSKHWLIIAWR